MPSQSVAPLLKERNVTLKSIYNAKKEVSLHPKSATKMGLIADGVFSKIVFVEAFVCFSAVSPNEPFFLSWPSGCRR